MFNPEYANIYDCIYKEKDYRAECDVVEHFIASDGLQPTTSILDLGCGTGNHAICLAQRGYHITGVDKSEAMLVHAENKRAAIELQSGRLDFKQGDIRCLQLNRTFDTVIMMFAVLGYQETNTDIIRSLQTVYRHINPRGLFLCDFWYGPAVLHLRPENRHLILATGDEQIERLAYPQLNIEKQLCTVAYHVQHWKNKQIMRENQESHIIRYFFPNEIESLFNQAGFSLLCLTAFPNIDREPDDHTWNVLAVAQAEEGARLTSSPR